MRIHRSVQLLDTLTSLTSLLALANQAAYTAICTGLVALITGVHAFPHACPAWRMTTSLSGTKVTVCL